LTDLDLRIVPRQNGAGEVILKRLRGEYLTSSTNALWHGFKAPPGGVLSGDTAPCVKSLRSSYTGLYPQMLAGSRDGERALGRGAGCEGWRKGMRGWESEGKRGGE